VFFGLAALNLRVDLCMFEMRFPMLTEGSRSEFSLPFSFGITMGEELFLAVFLGFSLKRSAF
jgi:hypothetical protein